MNDMGPIMANELARATGIGQARGADRKHGPAPKFSELLFQRVWRRVARGEKVGEAIRAESMETSRFYACVAARPRLAVALQFARENKLPAHMSTRAAGWSESDRRVKAGFAMDLQPDDVRRLSDRMLMLLLKQLAPEKYGEGPRGEAGKQRAETRGQRPEKTPDPEAPESVCDFVPQEADDELLTLRDCPEIDGKAEGLRLNAKVRNNEDSSRSASGGEAGEQRAEIRGQRPEKTPDPEAPESACDFVPQEADDELLTLRDCPEIDGKAEGLKLNAKVRNNEDSSRSASGGEAGEQRAEIRGQRSEKTPDRKASESACNFVPQNTGGDPEPRRQRIFLSGFSPLDEGACGSGCGKLSVLTGSFTNA
jgi:hypothetical protein